MYVINKTKNTRSFNRDISYVQIIIAIVTAMFTISLSSDTF